MSGNGTPALSSMTKRIVTGIVLGPVIVGLFWRGGFPFFVFLVLLTAFGQWELYRMCRDRLRFPHRLIGFTAGLVLLLGAWWRYGDHVSGVIAAALFFSFAVEVLADERFSLQGVLLSFFGAVYPPLFTMYLFRLSTMDLGHGTAIGAHLALYVLATIWVFDTASYFTGKFTGRRPFFKGISPKKTVEGFLGGLAAVIVLGIAAGLALGDGVAAHVVAISLIAAITGQVGDLSESIIKRECGVKDSSRLIPGHGGVLDRFDSLFFAAPAVHLYVAYVVRFTGGQW